MLGIDPGLTRCGVGVVDGSVGRPLTLVDVGVMRTSSHLPIAERLVTIERGLDAWIEEHQPDAVAVERVFARSDSSTIMGTAQASGIALVVRGATRAADRDAHPQRGQGRRVRQRPRRQGPGGRDGDAHPAPRREPPKPADAADALALAITHIWRGGAQARIDAAVAAARPTRTPRPMRTR